MVRPNKYEEKQIAAVRTWRAEEPGVVSKALTVASKPVGWLVQRVVPEKAIRGALDFANASGEWLADSDDILRDAEVQRIEDLRSKDLAVCDGIADEVHNWSIGIAVIEGGATGAFGILSAPVDVPAIITLALRTIHKIGLCYGYESDNEQDRQFVLAILTVSGANSVEEKVTALATLRAVEVALIKQTWKGMAAKTSQSQLSKEAALVSLRSLARQIGINLTKRRALAAIPVIGAFVGGSVNGWYMKEVGWAARRAFQERWLRESGKLCDDAPA